MDFMNEFGKKTAEACKFTADKTTKLAREAKLKIKMASNKSRIEELYEEIGKKVYENHIREEKKDLGMITLEECVEIDKLASEIDEARHEILMLKDKKQCPNCYYEIKSEYRFCPNCGKIQEEIVEERKENTTKEEQIVEQNKQEEEIWREHEERILEEYRKDLNNVNHIIEENPEEEIQEDTIIEEKDKKEEETQ